MKTIGLIGGMGPESTLDYYRGIIEAFKPTYEDTGNPEILIHSLNLREILAWAESNRWERITDALVDSCDRLWRAGAEVGAMASNTPHKVFDDIQSRTSLPLLSIVHAARAEAERQYLKTVLLMGTRFTMQSDFYQREFSKGKIQVVVPTEAQQTVIHEKLFTEIEYGIFKETTKHQLLQIIDDAKMRGADGVILGCTELPLFLHQEEIPIPSLNTTHLHIERIVQTCIRG